jgi:hypothetical protein
MPAGPVPGFHPEPGWRKINDLGSPIGRSESAAPEYRARRIRFRFVLVCEKLTRDQLWTIEFSCAFAVDGLCLPLRRFRKSHQLIPAGPGAT